MQITRIKIKNFLSISDVEIKPGQVTQITGNNNQGKTSIIKALDFAVKGSSDPSMVKLGEDAAEVLVELSDNTTIRRRLSAAGKQSVSVERDGASFKAPQQILGALFDDSSFNPLELLDSKNRTEAILRSIEIKVTPEVLAKELDLKVEDLPPLDYDKHGLKVLDDAHKYYYARRAEANKTAAEKKNRWETYQKDLPEAVPAPAKTRVELQKKRDEISSAMAEMREKRSFVMSEHDRSERAQKTHQSYVDAAAKIDLEIKDLEAKLDVAKGRRKEAQKYIDSAAAAIPKVLEALEPYEKSIRAAQADINDIDLQMKVWDTVDAQSKTVQMVKDLENEYGSAKKFAEQIDWRVQEFANVRSRLMASSEMPVPGLEFKDDQFFIDGVAVDNLSSSAALKLSIAVARKLAKKTKIICIDGAEQLDKQSWEVFENEIKGDGFEYFITKVGEPFPSQHQSIEMVGGVAQ